MEDDIPIINNNSFISNASSRCKTFGHNKFQIQLQEANSNIESLQQIIKDKDNEVELFKNNIKSFQIQFQEKNIDALHLKQELENYKNNLEIVTFDLNKLNLDKNVDETSLTNKYNNLHDEKIHLLYTISQVYKTNNETIEKYNELKSKYQTTLDLLEKKSNEYSKITSDFTDSVNELNLFKELNLKQEKDIDIVKQELFQSKNETSVLKSQLFEKDILLGDLHKKLELGRYTIRGKIIEQPIYIPDTEEIKETSVEPINEQDTVGGNKQPKFTNQRGLKLSRR
jgi:chromosome segregation ATPase